MSNNVVFLTLTDLDEPVQPPVKPRNAKYSHRTESISKGSDQTALISTDVSNIALFILYLL